MLELRWALLVLGSLFIVGLALWEWRKSRRRHFHDVPGQSAFVEPVAQPRRIEPSMDGVAMDAGELAVDFDVPTIHPVESVRISVAAESAVDVPGSEVLIDLSPEAVPSSEAVAEADAGLEIEFDAGAAVAAAPIPEEVPIKWSPPANARVLALRVVSMRGEPLSGRAIRVALDAAGLRHGPQQIFRQVDARGEVLVSVANLVRPGSFEPAAMDAQYFRGLNVFSMLPGPLPPTRMLDELVGLARTLAHRLNAVVQDAGGNDLDGVRLTQLQQSVAQEHP